MIKKIESVLFFCLFFLGLLAQKIHMEFPYFAGKTYKFIILQGDDKRTVCQGDIPEDGKFTLTIPEEYKTYTGISQWLITNTKEGGGLDMLIPGKDFSVSSKDPKPDQNNTIYVGNNMMKEMDSLYTQQNNIFLRYDAMQQAKKVYPETDKNYKIFQQEIQKQEKLYEVFQNKLRKRVHYVGELIKIMNIPRGIGTKLSQSDSDRAENILEYIANDLQWEILYTSGQWTNVIETWINIHTRVLKDSDKFARDFEKITARIKSPVLYTDFAGRTAYFLKQQQKENFIEKISAVVINSGKITQYEGSLMVFGKK